ncbi:MAG TPA: hypothetical protein VFX16_15540 [Pseudonocardiaceae bacterium]|nr:hypothetical protein [Pseudonocardiaceae bacterium]
MSDDSDDWVFQHHPDLIDPRWTKKTARAARKATRKARRREDITLAAPPGRGPPPPAGGGGRPDRRYGDSRDPQLVVVGAA